MAGDSSVATNGTKKKKKGILKRIGGGVAFRKKKKRPDDESVVGVAVDRGNFGGGSSSSASSAGRPRPGSTNAANSYSAAIINGSGDSLANSSGSSVSPLAKPIQVVLLLMDPSSRRFELLQLEFDSNKAMVSDVIRQIQSSATETTLRDMVYTGVCDRHGTEMIAAMKLSQFCQGNDVVMAMPKGLSGSDTAQLARPILGDPKVEDMLAPCGVKVSPQKRSRSGGSKLTKIAEEDIRRKEKKSSSPRKQVKSQTDAEKKSTKKKSSSSKLPTMILGAIIASLLFFTAKRHVSVTRRLESGHVLLPGQWKSQCGIFDLFPEEWLDKFPMNKLSSSCVASSSSVLELGREGTLRYFTKDSDGERKVMQSFVGGGIVYDGKQCSESVEGVSDEECIEPPQKITTGGATFKKDGRNWYVDFGEKPIVLSQDVVRDFMIEN